MTSENENPHSLDPEKSEFEHKRPPPLDVSPPPLDASPPPLDVSPPPLDVPQRPSLVSTPSCKAHFNPAVKQQQQHRANARSSARNAYGRNLAVNVFKVQIYMIVRL